MRADLDVERAASLVPASQALGGRLTLDGFVKGALSAPAIEARVHGSELTFQNLADGQLDLTGAFDLTSRQARVSSFEVEGAWGTATAEGEVSLDASQRSRLRATIERLDVAAVSQAIGLPYAIASRVDATLHGDWPGLDYLEASGAAEARLTTTAVEASPSVMPLAGRVAVVARDGRFDAQIHELRSVGVGLSGRLAMSDSQALDGTLRAEVQDVGRLTSSLEAFLRRPRGSLIPAKVGGSLVAQVAIDGTISAPIVHTTATAPALSLGNTSGIALSAEASVDPNHLTVQSVDLAWQEARVHLGGRVGLSGPRRLDLWMEANQVEAASVVQALSLQDVPVSGSFAARATVGGTVARPAVDATLEGRDLEAYEERLGSLAVDLNLDGREVELSRFAIEKPQPDGIGRLAARGSYHLDRRTYSVEVQSENARLLGLKLPSGQRIRADVQLDVKGAGTLEAPAGKTSLTIDSLEVDGLTASSSESAPAAAPLGRIVLDGVAANKQATITASADRFNLDLRAVVGLNRPWPTTVDLHANDLRLSALPLALPSPLDGSVRMTMRGSGDLVEPLRGEATLDVEALEGSWADQPFKLTSPARMRYADEHVAIERFELAARESTLSLSGSLPMTERAGRGEIDVAARAQLATLANYLPPETNITGDGVVTLTGSLAGTLEFVEPNLLLTVEDGLVLSPQLEPGFSNLVLRARVANGEAHIERLDGNWGSATIEASGHIPFEALPQLPIQVPRQSGPSTFNVAVRGLNPAAIPGAPRGLTGQIALDGQISAPRPELAALEGRISFPQLALAFGSLDLAQQQPSAIAIASGAATVEQFNLTGSVGSLAADGTVALVGPRALGLNVNGTLNVGAISVLTDKVQAEGTSTLQLAARGTVDAPEFEGSVEIIDATAASDEPNVAAEHINARLELSGKRISLTRLAANMNGGTFEGGGSVMLDDSAVPSVDLRVSTHDVAFDAPINLRSLSDADLTIVSTGDEIVVGGQVTIDEAGLTDDIAFDRGLMAAMTARRELNLTEERNPLLERVRFDINVDTSTPILVDNNVAQAEVTADLRLVGSPYEPGLTGRVTLLEGSEITLNERRYEAERGVITFVDEQRIQPSVDLLLNTSAGNYDITVAVEGVPGETETTLTSDPALPEPDIMAMLVTGRTLDEMRGEEFEVAREQVLSYMAGRVGSGLGRGLEKTTGLSEVRIEPNLIANEADPSARLTIGQELTDQLNLVYSTSLTDSNDRILVAEYDVTRRFHTRGVRQSDNSFRFDFSHDVRFGGTPQPRRIARSRPTVTEVVVAGDAETLEAKLRERFGVEAGDSYDYFAVRTGQRHVEDYLIQHGYLQSRVRLDRQVAGESARLTLRVTRGPLVQFLFEGTTPPQDVQDSLRERWHRGVFDKQRGEGGVEVLREWLMDESRLQPSIAYRIEDAASDRRQIVFSVIPGPQYRSIALAFEGASGVDPVQLDRIVDDQQMERQLFTDAEEVTDLLRRYYREQGYLAAEIDRPRYEYVGATARVLIPVREGPRFTVRRVSAEGNHALDNYALLQQILLTSGAPFLPSSAEQSLDRIRHAYRQRGYNAVRSDYEVRLDEGAGRVDVAFTVEEGPQSVIAEIVVEGNQVTSERLVREQIELETSEPLDLGLLARSRRNLYDTGAFSIVDITREELSGDVPAAADAAVDALAPEQLPVRLNVSVREVQPFQVRYGVSYDTERGVGGILEVSNHNSLGKARVLGVQSRYDRQLREARFYLSQPMLRYFPLRTTASLYFREELNPPTEISDAFDISRKGASIQQEVELRDAYVLSYGYRYERAQTIQPFQPAETQTLTVSPMTSTLTRDTRDEVLDASTGSFLSQALAYSPGWLGSDLPFLKYYGQYFYYVPLRTPPEKPLTGERERARLVFATGVRVGLARGLSGEVPPSERFYAGGSTTLRGFEQNAVGPIGVGRVPTGGNAVLVLNNELRVPLVSIVDGVVFADLGNVFDKVSDFSLSDLRRSGGVGLRVRTPWFLLRGDYGLVFDRRPGERRSRFYFSIGQAF